MVLGLVAPIGNIADALRRSGRDPAEAEPWARRMITTAIGIRREPLEFEILHTRVDRRPGDVFAVFTRGVHDYVPASALERLLIDAECLADIPPAATAAALGTTEPIHSHPAAIVFEIDP